MRAFVRKERQPQEQMSPSLARSDKATSGPNHHSHPVLPSQHTNGNQAARRLSQAKPEGFEAGSEATTNVRFAHDFARVPVHAKPPAGVQAKLTANTAGDIYEQEADRVADRIMRMPEPQPRRACACGGGCPRCLADHDGPGRGILQTMRTGPNDARGAAVPPVVDEVLRSPGQALDPEASHFFGPRFGHDFAGVRVHADAKAGDSARALNARAYTVGRDVVFARGQYQPATTSGRLLLAHELAHVVQQSGADAPRLQAKVVDDDEHLPCRGDAEKDAATLTARENEAAAMAEAAVPALRARPLGETARRLLWEKFRLDYNDPRVRCRFVPEIADRLARIARDIRSVEITYLCTPAGEPSKDCSGHWAATRARWPHGAYRIDLCANFWRDKPEQALTLLHEWAHYVFWTRGLRDELPGGFDTAGCYSAFALEVNGGAPSEIENTKCVPNPAPLPELDPTRVAQSCPSNVFVNLSLIGGYITGLPVRGDTLGGRLDLLFPLTRMHDRELSVGAQFHRLAPQDPTQRAAYMFGVRVGLHVRQQPWRGGWQIGGYVEGGGISLPGATGDRTYPYAGGGVTGGINIPLGRQQALQIFLDVGGRVGFDTQDSTQFGSFQSGLGVSLQL